MDFRKIYKNIPGKVLSEASILELGELYITEDGSRVRYLGEDEGSCSFEIETSSPLVEGYCVSELSSEKGGLPLFWKLLNIKDEDTNRYRTEDYQDR